ncbi:1,4-alpha-glucan branching enzyme [Aquibacillus albus]|uniref:1,4-alpha-glucan branching enzyme n=2 Tax=Aquibacillus albus TaxID=1168171 RepID=A0ABS2N5H4_9BACI|nr:1,4-alpha-glucan branching enzyme [Aquibacillus albus]
MEVFKSDDERFGGSDVVNASTFATERTPFHNQHYSLEMNVPLLEVAVLEEKIVERGEEDES